MDTSGRPVDPGAATARATWFLVSASCHRDDPRPRPPGCSDTPSGASGLGAGDRRRRRRRDPDGRRRLRRRSGHRRRRAVRRASPRPRCATTAPPAPPPVGGLRRRAGRGGRPGPRSRGRADRDRPGPRLRLRLRRSRASCSPPRTWWTAPTRSPCAPPTARPHDGEVLGTDDSSDVAVVKIDGGDDLAVAQLATGEDIRVGQMAVAIGSPFGLDQTVTAGIVSAVDRTVQTPGGAIPMLQTDAPINPGNSGGALADRHGRVIGINDSIASESGGNQGVGFAIPIDTAVSVAERLEKGEDDHRRVPRRVRHRPDAGRRHPGRLPRRGRARTARPPRPASQRGDLVTAVDGKAVESADRPGRRHPHPHPRRRGRRSPTSVTVSQRPPRSPSARPLPVADAQGSLPAIRRERGQECGRRLAAPLRVSGVFAGGPLGWLAHDCRHRHRRGRPGPRGRLGLLRRRVPPPQRPGARAAGPPDASGPAPRPSSRRWRSPRSSNPRSSSPTSPSSPRSRSPSAPRSATAWPRPAAPSPATSAASSPGRRSTRRPGTTSRRR